MTDTQRNLVTRTINKMTALHAVGILPQDAISFQEAADLISMVVYGKNWKG
jgi:hypothetical protein